jgi:photosystem II stability/assembly factor-like uncharacterized protein
MKKSIILLVSLVTLFSFSKLYSQWALLPNAPYNGGKQDGIHFFNKDIGWVVNGSGKIYKTIDGGDNWIQQKNSAGTYFRAIAFIDNQTGFAGNVGTNYFPGVTDTNPLYKTIDGGNSWSPVTANITGTVPTGICAIQAVNANVIYAAGRVGGPAVMMKSTDGGSNWVGTTLPNTCKMVLDLHFQTPDVGYIFTGTNTNVALSKARILKTTDGGATWTTVYTSNRNYEMIWKAWFPSTNVGYATIQSYDSSASNRYIVKTTDGGQTWTELPLSNTGVREFGIGFINENVGWVGCETEAYETQDGGTTWSNVNLGEYANKFSIISNPDGTKTCYAAGLNVSKYTTSNLNIDYSPVSRKELLIYPNPAPSGSYVSISLEKIPNKVIKAELISVDGKLTSLLFNSYFVGTSESPFQYKLPNVTTGNYIIQFTDEKGKTYTEKIIITN